MVEMNHPPDVRALTEDIQANMTECIVQIDISADPAGYVVTVMPDDSAYFYKFYPELPETSQVFLDFNAKIVAAYVDESIMNDYKNEFP